MADPFAVARGTLFAGPRATAADYQPVDGAAMPIRVIHSLPDREVAFGQGQIVLATNSFRVRRADVAEPATGDRIAIAAGTFEISGEPELDEQGFDWICPAEPVE